MKKQYKNISGVELSLPGIGIVKPDGIITQPAGFNNANFVEVKAKEEPKPNVVKDENKPLTIEK